MGPSQLLLKMEKGGQYSLGKEKRKETCKEVLAIFRIAMLPKLNLCKKNFPKKQGDLKQALTLLRYH